MAEDEIKERAIQELPWPEVENVLKNYRGEKEERDITADGKKIATVIIDKHSNGNPAIVKLESSTPIVVSEDGVYAGTPNRTEKPHIKFERDNFNIAVLADKHAAHVTFLPVTSEEKRKFFDSAHTKDLLFSGKEIRVTDDSHLPRQYTVGKDQTLKLSMPLPEQLLSEEKVGYWRPAVPVTMDKVKLEGGYHPKSPGALFVDDLFPEANVVTLPGGSRIDMQPGAKLKLSYHVQGKEIDVLDFKAPGQKDFKRSVEAEEILKKHPPLIAAADKKLEETKKIYKAFSEDDRSEAQRAAQTKFYDSVEKSQDLHSEYKKAQYGRQAPTGELAKSFETASEKVRELIKQRDHERTVGVAESQKALAQTITTLKSGAKPEDGDVATVPKIEEGKAIALFGNRLITDPEEIKMLKMHAFVKERKLLADDDKKLPEGVAIKNGVLVIDNTSDKPVTLHLLGNGRDLKLETPLQVVMRGPVTVDASAGLRDKFSGQPLTIQSVTETGKKPVPVNLVTDKWIERQFLERDDALSRNDRYREGLTKDDKDNVNGFQVGEKGPIVHMQPGQEIHMKSNRLVMEAVENIFNPADKKIYTFPEHNLIIRGGRNENDTFEDLKEQHKKEEETKPVQKRDPKEPNNEMTISAPSLPAHLLHLNKGKSFT